MRIKKKELLEALDVTKTKDDKEEALKIAEKLGIEGANTKQEIVNTLGNTPRSEEIADDLVSAALTNEEDKEVKPKKRKVKEVIKVKNLKK